VRDATISRNYAEALFELGEKHGSHDEFVAGLNTFAQVLESDASVRHFLITPKIELQRKQQALRAALGDQVSPMLLNFVLVVMKKRRQALLREIALEYSSLLDEKQNRVHAQVTLAHEPDAATESKIATELSRILGKTVVPHVTVNPEILGGIVVRYGDHIMDGSLKRRLVGLRQRLIETAMPLQA
jgi:F-type H+-transporting ATPase subunit delta